VVDLSVPKAKYVLFYSISRRSSVISGDIHRYPGIRINRLASVVQTLDSAIHRINLYPVDSTIGFPNTYPLDSDLSSGQRYPPFEQLGPSLGQKFTLFIFWQFG